MYGIIPNRYALGNIGLNKIKIKFVIKKTHSPHKKSKHLNI